MTIVFRCDKCGEEAGRIQQIEKVIIDSWNSEKKYEICSLCCGELKQWFKYAPKGIK